MGQTHQREAAIFDAAMELPPEQRAAHLDHACGGDAALRQRMESLLKACESSCGFLDSPTDPVADGPTNVLPSFLEKAGDTIGRYKLLQQIGEGGCGVVYMAEQLEPVRRRVALKIIKLGMDTKSVIARFEAERQALAMMDHPNIAKVFDAGATEAGRPYFVMELVRGMKITEYCDEKKLSTRQRLDLFIQVCQAIQHAHQKGIIHRDIKPSNILVSMNDGVLVPKVIDFGIAKATTGQQLTDKTVFTAFEQFIGTPAYMSPEQAVLTSLDIDTRSDIYALGVLLYELLTGKTPFDAKELLAIGLDEMRRTICEQEPPRPSTRLSTLSGQELSTTAQRRGLDAPKLVSELRGDLDWIVMKALEKDRARRYETANGLAMDIQRHLHNEPVVARPPSNLYRFQKMMRRNKLAFAAGAAVLVSLVLGLGLSTWLFFQERAAKREQGRLRAEAQAKEQIAQAEAAKSEQVAQFLKEMLKGLGPSVAWGGDRTLLQEMLKQTAERIGRGLTNQPEIAVSLRLTLAETYDELGLYQAEAEIAEQTLLFGQSMLGKENLPVANCLAQLGWAECFLGRLAEAEKHSREGLALHRKLLGNDHALVGDSLLKLCFVLCERDMDDREKIGREALTLFKKLSRDPDIARSLAMLGYALRTAGKSGEAEPYVREALTMHRELFGNGHFHTTTALNKLAMVLMDLQKFPEAEELMREALATQRKLLGDKHPELVWSLSLLGKILASQKRFAEAEAMFAEARAMVKKLHGSEYPFVSSTALYDVPILLRRLAETLVRQGKLEQAEAVYRELLETLRAAAEKGDASALNNLAWLLATCSDSAIRDGQSSVGFAEKAVTRTDRKDPGYLNTLAAAYAEAGEFAKAVNVQNEAIALLHDEKGKNDYATRLKLYQANSPYREP